MALITCSECHHEISDQATACPNCGRPLGQPNKGTRPVQSSARRFVGLVFTGVLCVLGYLALQSPLKTAGILPAARFNFDNAGGDESCTRLGDYCMRIRCTVTNVGNASGIARAGSRLIEDGSAIASQRTTTKVLAPGQRETVTFEFVEASLASKKAQYACFEAN